MGCGASSGATASPPPLSSDLSRTKCLAEIEFEKYLKDFGQTFSNISYKDKVGFIGIIGSEKGLEICLYLSNGEIWSSIESELYTKKHQKEWSSFFTAIKTQLCKSGLKEVSGDFVLTIPKGTSPIQFTLKMDKDVNTLHRILFVPLLTTYLQQKTNPQELKFVNVELECNSIRAFNSDSEQKILQLQTEIEPLAKSARQAQDDARAAKEQCDGVRRLIRKVIKASKQEHDDLYPDAPTLYLLHTIHSKEHVPAVIPCNRNAMHAIKEKYGGDTTVPPPTSSNLNHEDIMKVLNKIDDWDFDVFELSKHTNGGALFMTSYCLLYKYGLVQHFNLDDQILINFFQAVESGYHPNHYHNATHAADVLQITHYILDSGGLRQRITLTQADILASLLSAAIHDYDHPGFNNHFHIRTHSYLAVLYNDRSVLENHHLAQVFELMKNPKYNIFSGFPPEVYRDIRDTMVEMVISTDMGNHPKILNNFQKRIREDKEWGSKEDTRLALSIAIKLADISNCCRPSKLYTEWAKRIALEFYHQGDAESRLGLSISPFMDRRKDKMDFPKGQISFMNYIVIPLFEAAVVLLPKMDFTIRLANSNKADWVKQTAIS